MAERSRPIDSLGEHGIFEEEMTPRPLRRLTHRRALGIVAALVALVLLVLLPPLLNVNRYKRQIASSISASLGRPVHIDSVTLKLLPMPGFTLENFVVGEDPAFGAEPVIRAGEVRATLRMSSLWRRRVEFSRIVLDAPSVNLVHLPDGRWNLESILLQASRMPAAPTAQKGAGRAQRFPYIEATGGRVNLKMGLEKMPLSLTEADFALWLPQPDEWHLRLKAHPARTDAAAMDSGVLRAEGTLGRAVTLAGVPVDLQAEWSAAPLGALSWLVMGRDAGMRGEMNLTASVQGTMGRNKVTSRLQLEQVRRADFVPAKTLSADVSCTAEAASVFHALRQIRCNWPADSGGLLVTGEIPDLQRPAAATGTVELRDVPAGSLLDALRVASNRVSPDLAASGKISGRLACCGPGVSAGAFKIDQASLGLAGRPVFLAEDGSATFADEALTLPVQLDLGAKDPALLTIKADRTGYSLALIGMALRSRLDALAVALPQFGDGLEELLGPAAGADVPLRLDLIGSRLWGGPASWSAVQGPKPPAGRKSLKHGLR